MILPILAVLLIVAYIALMEYMDSRPCPYGDVYTVQVQKGKGSFVSLKAFNSYEDAEFFAMMLGRYGDQSCRIIGTDGSNAFAPL